MLSYLQIKLDKKVKKLKESKPELNDPFFFRNLKKCILNTLFVLIGIGLILGIIITSFIYVKNNINFVHDVLSPYIIGFVVLMAFCMIVTECVKEKTDSKYKNTIRKLQILSPIFASIGFIIGMSCFIVHLEYGRINFECHTVHGSNIWVDEEKCNRIKTE